MRILWDFRLFSYGYRDRGIGVFCRAMIKAIMDADASADARRRWDILIWGNRNHVPAELAKYAARWIPYEKGTWKSDLFMIPFIIIRHRVQLFHYWAAMGPVFRIGIGLFHPCAACMTVFDLGVEQLRNDDFLNHVRHTRYWRVQKMLLARAPAVVCISQKTKEELNVFTKGNLRRCDVIYMPMAHGSAGAKPPAAKRMRMRMFVTLAGAPHKNVHGVVQAFSIFMKSHPGFCLVVLGDAEAAEAAKNREPSAAPRCDTVFFEGMDRYEHYLDNAAGFVACSTYEGLGIPPLEALSHGCPLIASDMPVFHETCGDAARFVDPHNAASIAEGMCDVADHQEEWMGKSLQGFERYKMMSEGAGKQWIELYKSLLKF